MDKTLLEMVARAICIADGEDPDAFHSRADLEEARRKGYPITDHAIPLWLGYRGKARAALEAMRDWDQAMLDAGTAVLTPPLVQGAPGFLPGSSAIAVWEAMIDAALTPSAPSRSA